MSALGRVYRGETRVDFIGKRNLWFAISGVVIAICLGSLIVRGFDYGIEFEGGVAVQAPVDPDGPAGDLENTAVIAEVRDALEEFGASDAQIQVEESTDGDDRNVIVQTAEIDDPEVQQEVVNAVSETVGSTIAETDSQRIGSKWGGEITDKAIRALVIFLFVILAFISWRFDWKMGFAAIVALLHDLFITAGIYSLVGFEVTPSTVIAILTILGYSLYDTVVVFDKVEEDADAYAGTGRMTYQDAANLAMNQVFARSLNTSLTTLIPVAALLFVGAGLAGAATLKDLALALFVGILGGTYSSIYIATPVLSIMKEREPRYRNVREKKLREAQRAETAAQRKAEVLSPAAETAGAGAAPAVTRGTGAPPRGTAAPPRARAGNKKAKRRKRR
ncbi:MAG: protein translocase subunit SecF [Actinomycetota bacterium]|nr:protein translocase subunit SecF [Actinomycetota bacterium]